MVEGVNAFLFFVRRAGFSETPRPPPSFLQKIFLIFCSSPPPFPVLSLSGERND